MNILYILLVLLIVTRTFGELVERAGQPALPEVTYLFSAIVMMAVVTTLLTPITLKWIFR